MLTLVDLRGYDGDPLEKLPRAQVDRDAARAVVREVVAAVRQRGDDAVLGYQERFGARPQALRVPADEIASASASCSPALRGALEEAASRVRAFHERQAAEERAPFWRVGADGISVGEETRPVARAGCYVPGGRAAYPSSVLMTVIPARVAGVRTIAVACPPGREGHVHPATLAACAIAGADEVYAVGGAQAIAALGYGTATVPRVDVIVGPGNLYVTLAKHEVCLDVGVDSFAGPTEVAIVADDSAPPRAVAADLVAQAEHDPLATALLITPSSELIERVEDVLAEEVARASRSGDITRALEGQGRAVLVEDIARAIDVANAFAPEHLELMVEDADAWLPRVRGAGAVFVGATSPVALGDYVAGTNHVLPTAGTARFASPLRVSTFLVATAVVSFDRAALERIAPTVRTIAEAEGLDAHARAIDVRLESS